jgi:hypothetical protein
MVERYKPRTKPAEKFEVSSLVSIARNCSMPANRLLPVSLLVIAALTGCAAGPDFKRPAAPAAKGYTPAETITAATVSAPVPAGESQRFNPAADIPFDWWTLFQSPQINSLISKDSFIPR